MSTAVRLRIGEVAREKGMVHDIGPRRGQANLSELARQCRASYTAIINHVQHPESKKGISLDLLARLCEVLHCHPGELFELVREGPEVKASLSDKYKRNAEYNPYTGSQSRMTQTSHYGDA